MRRFSLVVLIPMIALFLFASTAGATPINPLGEWSSSTTESLQGVLDGITVSPSPNPGKSSVDASGDQNDALFYDSYWSITATGGSVATFVVEIAGFAPNNKFGIFDASDPNKKVQIFDGQAGSGSHAVLSIKADGSVYLNLADTGMDFSGNRFGYYLTNGAATPQTFHSDTGLNADAFDHMVALQGKNIDYVRIAGLSDGLWTDREYILAWEDLYGGGDWDYNDMVIMVESVNPAPVPEPATMLLFGAGLIGLAGFGRKKLIKK